MKKFKAFTNEPNDAFIDGLKAHLEGVTVIISSEDGKDGDDDRNLGRNAISGHVTQGAGTSKPRATGKTLMIENFEEHVIRLEESIKDIVDFMKDERLRRAEKENQKKRNEIEAVAEKKNLDEGDEDKEEEKNEEAVCEKNEEAVCEEENKADGSASVEKENHDEGR
ncbi:hypothetical protein FXO37_06488 [Capsicum annuum]|nr:hypothetical protein FXO37_06488 [Capsicum annuum]